MFGNGKIIETLATIKANTSNHKDILNDLKDTFNKHVEKEEKQQVENRNKMNEIHAKVSKIDKCFAKDISSLQTRSKYNLLSMAGLWSVIAVTLKKIFTS